MNLTLKALSKMVADNIIIFFSDKIRLDISCELSTELTIHMQCQALFSLKKKMQEKSKCCLLQFWLAHLQTKFMNIFLFFSKNRFYTFHVNYLQRRQFTWSVKPNFLEKTNKKNMNFHQVNRECKVNENPKYSHVSWRIHGYLESWFPCS